MEFASDEEYEFESSIERVSPLLEMFVDVEGETHVVEVTYSTTRLNLYDEQYSKYNNIEIKDPNLGHAILLFINNETLLEFADCLMEEDYPIKTRKYPPLAVEKACKEMEVSKFVEELDEL